jgi:hypothetical protein
MPMPHVSSKSQYPFQSSHAAWNRANSVALPHTAHRFPEKQFQSHRTHAALLRSCLPELLNSSANTTRWDHVQPASSPPSNNAGIVQRQCRHHRQAHCHNPTRHTLAVNFGGGQKFYIYMLAPLGMH